MLDVISIYQIHECPLQTCCPYSNCAKQIYAFHPNAQNGFCPYCSRWLGYFESKAESIDAETWNSQQFITKAVGDLLSMTPEEKLSISREAIHASIDNFVKMELEDNSAALARLISVEPTTIRAIRKGSQLPQIGTLLKICAVMGTTPLEVLKNGGALNNAERDIHLPTAKKAKRRPRQFDVQEVNAKLEAKVKEFSPRPMSEIGVELDYDQAFLCNKLPDICRRISQRFYDYQHEQSMHRTNQDCELAQQRTLELHSKGIYPSPQRIGGILRDRSVRAVYLETMRELGYRQ